MKNALSEKGTGAECHRWVWRLFSKSLYNKFKASISKPWCSPVAHTHKNPLLLSKELPPWEPRPVWKGHTPSTRWALEHTWSPQLCKTDYSTSQQPVKNRRFLLKRLLWPRAAVCLLSLCTNNAQQPQSLPISCRQQGAWQVWVPVCFNTCAGTD